MSVSGGRAGFSYVRGYEPQEELTLLTDRSLYRPGQTVHVKGIAYHQLPDTAHVQVGKSYTLTLWDANRQEVARQEVRTNDFGSFATTFTLPSACLNGDFMIRTDHFIHTANGHPKLHHRIFCQIIFRTHQRIFLL